MHADDAYLWTQKLPMAVSCINEGLYHAGTGARRSKPAIAEQNT